MRAREPPNHGAVHDCLVRPWINPIRSDALNKGSKKLTQNEGHATDHLTYSLLPKELFLSGKTLLLQLSPCHTRYPLPAPQYFQTLDDIRNKNQVLTLFFLQIRTKDPTVFSVPSFPAIMRNA